MLNTLSLRIKNPKLVIKANSIARQHHCGKATEIEIGNENKIISFVSCGYRKYTTGEYVSNAYRANFGWKNTYYQTAQCKVMVQIES